MINNEGLAEERRKLETLIEVLDEEITSELDGLGMDWRDDCRENTPTITGDLKRSWNFRGTERRGNSFVVEVSNNVEYAKHFELGHRQNVGQYVPSIGKRLKAPYVKGRYVCTNARERANQTLSSRIKKALARAEVRLND